VARSSSSVFVMCYVLPVLLMFFVHNGPYSDINFAMKDRGLTLLKFTYLPKVRQNSVCIIKGHNFD